MDPQDLIAKLLGETVTPNDYVEQNFPKPMHWDDFLQGSPMSTNVIDRRYGAEDLPATAQQYIDEAFQELNDPRVR